MEQQKEPKIYWRKIPENPLIVKKGWQYYYDDKRVWFWPEEKQEALHWLKKTSKQFNSVHLNIHQEIINRLKLKVELWTENEIIGVFPNGRKVKLIKKSDGTLLIKDVK